MLDSVASTPDAWARARQNGASAESIGFVLAALIFALLSRQPLGPS
jgi:hypothetical protein